MTALPSALPLDDLGRRVVDKVGMPKDAWEIAAQLEVMGMRDSDARSGYGVRDLFELARAIERRFRGGAYGFRLDADDPQPKVLPWVRFIRRYLAGISFALPMAMQAAAMLIWGYGIWGAIDLELAQGSAIALGFIASYIAAGGFAQAIVRRGLFYIYQQEEGLARWTAFRGFAIALRVTLALIVPALLANLLFRILPWSMVLTATLFYAGLTVLWLAWALLYLVQRTELLFVITAIGLAAVIASARIGGVAPIVANGIGVLVASTLSCAAAAFFLGRMAKKQGNREPVNPPRLSVLVFSTSRYFVYGVLFNAFLFIDRLIAWTTPVGREDFPPYPFWLNARYELAMDLALVVVIVMGGFVQYATERFSDKLIPHEKRTKSGDRDLFAHEQLDAHRRRTIQLAICALVALVLAWLLLVTLRDFAGASQQSQRLHEALTAPVTMRVFVIAAIGYTIFMFAVRNLLLLLTLSRIEPAVRSVAYALVANAAVGFVCSRAIGYWGAVAGVAAGAIVMSIVASRETRRVLEHLDYSYYAAY